MPLVNTSFTSLVPLHIKTAVLEDYLAQRFSYFSKEQWCEKISNQEVQVNGLDACVGTLLSKSDQIVYFIRNYNEPEVPTDIEVIFENNSWAILGKSAPIPMHRSGRILVNTFVHLAQKKLNCPELTPFHRIDAETSGLILFGKSHKIAQQYQKHLNILLQRKFYLCIVNGSFPQDRTLHCNLGEIQGDSIRSRMHVLPEGQGKASVSHFYSLQSTNSLSLLLVEIETGRKHQIRAMLAHLGYPIVGDKIYSHQGKYYLKRIESELDPFDFEQLGAQNHLLHSLASFIHLPNEMPQLFTSLHFSKDFEKYLLIFPQGIEQAHLKINALIS